MIVGIQRISKPEKGTVKDFLDYFRLFVSLAKWKFPALFVLFLLVGLFDSVGIVMFLPLLEEMQVGAEATQSGLLEAITSMLGWLHLGSFTGILIFLVIVFFLKFLAVFGQSAAVARIGRDLYRELADKLLCGIGRAEYAKLYLKTSTGYVANALTRELQVFLAAFTHYAGILASGIFICVYLFFSFLLDGRMTLIALAAGGVIFFFLRSLTWMSRREGMALTKASGEYHEGVVQFMQHYKYLKATGRFPRVQAHLQSIIHRLTQARYRLSLIGGFIHSLPEPIAVILLAVILYVYVVIWQNSFTLVAVLLLLLYRTVMRLMALQSEWNGFFAASGALRVIPETLTAIDRDKEEIGKGKTSGLTEGIELKDVSYAYGEKEALKQVSVQIPKHATIALVGMSGGGKSTLVDILTAVLKPDQGSVTYDGSPYEDLDVEILRQKMGYVTQEITIFNDSILRNVTFWDPETGDQHERVVDACERSQCRGFIEDLPEGYHTHVGDRGINLSVGQRQRIAIARELYRDPEVLIFDEATSALDSESERAIQASIEALKGSKTLVLIAHRLSTIKNADHIYVLDHGRIAEHGTFGELYSNPSSVFRRMCDLQSFDGAGDV